MVKVTNTSCANGQWFYLRFTTGVRGGGEFYQKYIANNSTLLPGKLFTIPFIYAAGLQITILSAADINPFKYEFSYQMVDTSANDVETIMVLHKPRRE